jgi:hypothetical protein
VESIIEVVVGPVSADFHLASDVLRKAASSGLHYRDLVKHGERRLRFSLRRNGSNVEQHFLEEQEHVFDLVEMVRKDVPELPVQLSFVVYGNAQNGMFLTQAQVHRIAGLGMSMDIDFYDISDGEGEQK